MREVADPPRSGPVAAHGWEPSSAATLDRGRRAPPIKATGAAVTTAREETRCKLDDWPGSILTSAALTMCRYLPATAPSCAGASAPDPGESRRGRAARPCGRPGRHGCRPRSSPAAAATPSTESVSTRPGCTGWCCRTRRGWRRTAGVRAVTGSPRPPQPTRGASRTWSASCRRRARLALLTAKDQRPAGRQPGCPVAHGCQGRTDLYGDHPAIAVADLGVEVQTEVRLLRASQAEQRL